MVAHVPVEIDLGSLAVRGGLEQYATRAVIAGKKHVSIVNDGRGNVGGAVGDPGVSPEQRAILGVEADGSLRGEQGQGVRAADIQCNRRGIAGLIVLRLPEEVARVLVQCHDSRAGPAGHDDEAVAIHQRRFGVPRLRRPAAEALDQVQLPNAFAGGGFEAHQRAIGGQVHTSARPPP